MRTPYANLENPLWWKSLRGQGVVLYAWGSPRYLPIARAIRQAGLSLVCNMDTSGMLGVLAGPVVYWGSLWRIAHGIGHTPASWAWWLGRLVSSCTWSLVKTDPGRARHLRQAHLIGAVSPLAWQHLRRVCRWYGGEALASRVHLIPHPVNPQMQYNGQRKRPLVVSVARWHREDWRQKNPRLLMQTLALVLQENPEVTGQVVGRMEEEIKTEFLRTVGPHRNRLILSGRIPNPDLVPLLQSAQISLCTSNHESFHIASAEALCCGCSVVAPDLPELPSLRWFTGESCGQLAEKSPERLAQGVTEELRLWRNHQRDASHIGSLWGGRLHADRVAERILHLLSSSSPSPLLFPSQRP